MAFLFRDWCQNCLISKSNVRYSLKVYKFHTFLLKKLSTSLKIDFFHEF